jgi:CheY-like chemotaxis protein
VTRILLIDDSATSRAVLKVYLSGLSYELLEAADGESGLKLARQMRPAVILLDLKMPGMDGLTFCRSLRSDPILRPIPVILISGTRSTLLAQEAVRIGARTFLTKPINDSVLRTLVVQYLKEAK